MSMNFPKPENVLRKALDLIAVGKEDVALETLHTVLIPRKHRTWSDIYEQVCGPVFDLRALISLELATSDDQTYQK